MTIGLYDLLQGISPAPGAQVKLARVVARTNVSGLTGLPTIDSVALAAGDRVLLTAQSTASQNGLWTTTGSGTAWTRSNDADDGYKLRSGVTVIVSEGGSYTGTFWQLQTTGTIVVGTTSLTFTQVAVSGGGGVSDGDKGDITVSGSGATWTIDNDAVTFAKMQNITDARLLGRSAGSAGDCQEITVDGPLTLTAGVLDVSVGTLATDVCAGNDARLSDARTPTAHQSSHQSGGSDALSGNLDAIARTTVRKNTGADVGSRRRLNFIEGSNVTLTVADDAASEEVDITIAASGGPGGGGSGYTTVNFGSFPGTSDASVVVSGQTSILATSVVQAWIDACFPTADHTADEHILEPLRVVVSDIVAGNGFTIKVYAADDSPRGTDGTVQAQKRVGVISQTSRDRATITQPNATGVYGQFSVAWRWS